MSPRCCQQAFSLSTSDIDKDAQWLGNTITVMKKKFVPETFSLCSTYEDSIQLMM
jgi:hypothetical protein